MNSFPDSEHALSPISSSGNYTLGATPVPNDPAEALNGYPSHQRLGSAANKERSKSRSITKHNKDNNNNNNNNNNSNNNHSNGGNNNDQNTQNTNITMDK